MGTLVRGLLGGLAAFWSASGAYAVLDMIGVRVTWEAVAATGWSGFVTALLIGMVEEGAKLAGIGLALTSRRGHEVFWMTAAVAAVFGVGEAAVLLDGWSWPVALGRVVLSPVAHAALLVPVAAVLAAPTSRRAGWRVLAALLAAASLHGWGDWSLARASWGRIGFAASMLLPVLWLYWRARVDPSWTLQPCSVRSSARSSSATPRACATQPRGV